MGVREKPPDTFSEPLKTTLENFCTVVAFSIAFGYIEAAVVVYLREIFHPDGFTFPMKVFGAGPRATRLLLTEIGREVATIVLILTGAGLFGRNRRQQVAYFDRLARLDHGLGHPVSHTRGVGLASALPRPCVGHVACLCRDHAPPPLSHHRHQGNLAGLAGILCIRPYRGRVFLHCRLAYH
jgi:hypothetical protein